MHKHFTYIYIYVYIWVCVCVCVCLKQDMPPLSRVVKIMKTWSKNWGAEQCQTLRFKNLLGGVLVVTIFFSLNLDSSITWISISLIVCNGISTLMGYLMPMRTQLKWNRSSRRCWRIKIWQSSMNLEQST